MIKYIPNHDACSSVKKSVSGLSKFSMVPRSAGITIVGNATAKPKSNSKKFFAVLANTCGRIVLNVLASSVPASSGLPNIKWEETDLTYFFMICKYALSAMFIKKSSLV